MVWARRGAAGREVAIAASSIYGSPGTTQLASRSLSSINLCGRRGFFLQRRPLQLEEVERVGYKLTARYFFFPSLLSLLYLSIQPAYSLLLYLLLV